MRNVNEFIKWAKKETYRRGLVCHFYIHKSKKQYYDKTDYAYFNLFCDSQDWIVKGTTGHGISSQRNKRSKIPCLNCFEVNDKFYKAIRKLSAGGNDKFKFGIILNKRILKKDFEVINVSTIIPNGKRPPLNECHCFDIAHKRRWVLNPFNYCDVIRIEIPESEISEEPITRIPKRAIAGMLVKNDDSRAVNKLLKENGKGRINVFPIL